MRKNQEIETSFYVPSESNEEGQEELDALTQYRIYTMDKKLRPYKDLKDLQARANKFFAKYNKVDLAEVIPPTVTELAHALGFSTKNAMKNFIKANKDNERGGYVSYYMEQCEVIAEKKMLIMAQKTDNSKALQYVLDRYDNDVADIIGEQRTSAKDKEKITISVEIRNRSNNIISEQIKALTSECYEDAQDAIIVEEDNGEEG